MSKQKEKREPLLYIHQPAFKAPEGKMQETFSSRKAEERKREQLLEKDLEKKSPGNSEEKRVKKKGKIFSEELQGVTGGFASPSHKEQLPSEEVQKMIEEYDEEKREISSESEDSQSDFFFKRVKSFKEMNVMERLDYLNDFPKQLPPVPCLFQTDKKAVRGFLTEKTEERIEVKLLDKSTISIPINEIKQVKMIGLT